MKSLLLLAVLIAASVDGSPNLPTTFLTDYSYTITTSSPKLPKVTGTGKLSEDNANKKKVDCTLAQGRSTTLCRLTDYNAKTLYIYGKDSTGKVVNCTARPLPSNASTYRNQWVWLPEAKDEGSASFGCCNGAELWELKFEGKIDLKVCANGNTPVGTDYRISNSTGFGEKVSCFKNFSTTLDQSLLVPPPSCKPGLTYLDEEEDLFFLLHALV